MVKTDLASEAVAFLLCKGAPKTLTDLLYGATPKTIYGIIRAVSDIPNTPGTATAVMWADLIYNKSPLIHVTRGTGPREIVDVHSEHARIQYFKKVIRNLQG